ncbi:MAG: hypothetical protein P8188_05995 [Gemmatimonadota bacterium]
MTWLALPWILLSLSASAHPPAPPDFCSKIPFASGVRPEAGVFVGAPRTDSVWAGPGSVEYVSGPGHSGSGRGRRIYGQVFEVQRYMDPTPGLREHERVAVVPWDYGPGCRPVPWSRSAVWVTEMERGLLRGTLREESEWVGGMPTYDVWTPEFGWYTGRPFREFGRTPEEVDDALSVDELFELYALLPTWPEIQARGWDAASPAVAWMKDRTPDGTAYPVASIAQGLIRAAEDHRAREVDLRVRGTWEISVQLPSGRVETVYWRTSASAEGAWYEMLHPGRRDTTRVAPWDRRADGFSFHFWHARERSGLPTDSASAVRELRGIWDVAVVDSAGEVGWRAVLQPSEVEAWWPEDEEISAAVARYLERATEGWESGRSDPLPGRFFLQDDTLRFEQPVELGEEELLWIRGRRIAMESVDRRR